MILFLITQNLRTKLPA